VPQATRNDNTKQKARKEMAKKNFKKKKNNANEIAKHKNAQCSQNTNDQFF
jgi:hypothetical protein